MAAGIPIFRPGDMILVDAAALTSSKVRASIQMIRCVKVNKTGLRKALGCDVITEQGECRFFFMDDIVRWNINKVKEAFP